MNYSDLTSWRHWKDGWIYAALGLGESSAASSEMLFSQTEPNGVYHHIIFLSEKCQKWVTRVLHFWANQPMESMDWNKKIGLEMDWINKQKDLEDKTRHWLDKFVSESLQNILCFVELVRINKPSGLASFPWNQFQDKTEVLPWNYHLLGNLTQNIGKVSSASILVPAVLHGNDHAG